MSASRKIRTVPRCSAGGQHVKHREPAGLVWLNDPASSILIQLFRQQLPLAIER